MTRIPKLLLAGGLTGYVSALVLGIGWVLTSPAPDRLHNTIMALEWLWVWPSCLFVVTALLYLAVTGLAKLWVWALRR